MGYSARARGSPRARQAINGACHWLQIMGTAVRQARHDRPLSAADLELLRAVPAGACLPRRRPDTGGPVRRLPEAVVATAERARHAAWLSDSQPPWRPGMSVNSLRQTAAASTLTSYHCETLLRSLARGQRMAGEPGIALRAAAGAVGRTRTRWLGIAHALDQVASSNQEQPWPVATAAGDLALWTGRLAYSNPGWTLASGPARATEPVEKRSREPGEMTEVLDAVHDACDAMSRIASADRRQVRALAAAGQVLVDAGPDQSTLDILGPLAPARPDRIGALLTLYHYTAQASAEATTTASAAATAAMVPHRPVLPAIHAGRPREPVTPEAAEQIADAQSLYEPGRIERTLRGLGVTDIDLLRRGEKIDQAAEQLIIQAAEPNPVHRIHPVQAYACKPSNATMPTRIYGWWDKSGCGHFDVEARRRSRSRTLTAYCLCPGPTCSTPPKSLGRRTTKLMWLVVSCRPRSSRPICAASPDKSGSVGFPRETDARKITMKGPGSLQ